MPTGPGIFYRKSGEKFSMEPMLTCGKKVSKECLEWLTYEQSQFGEGQIIHGYNFGEVKVAGYSVDGFWEGMVNGQRKKIVWEYNGCFFHDCSLCETVS